MLSLVPKNIVRLMQHFLLYEVLFETWQALRVVVGRREGDRGLELDVI